jgi:hypothetical protein
VAQVLYKSNGNVIIRRDITQPTATNSVRLPKTLKEIDQIKAENPDLYEALSKDDPNLIK